MVALAALNEGMFLGPVVRERVAELIAQDIAEAVRNYLPGASVMVDGEHAKPYAAFLWGCAREIWEELQSDTAGKSAGGRDAARWQPGIGPVIPGPGRADPRGPGD